MTLEFDVTIPAIDFKFDWPPVVAGRAIKEHTFFSPLNCDSRVLVVFFLWHKINLYLFALSMKRATDNAGFDQKYLIEILN